MNRWYPKSTLQSWWIPANHACQLRIWCAWPKLSKNIGKLWWIATSLTDFSPRNQWLQLEQVRHACHTCIHVPRLARSKPCLSEVATGSRACPNFAQQSEGSNAGRLGGSRGGDPGARGTMSAMAYWELVDHRNHNLLAPRRSCTCPLDRSEWKLGIPVSLKFWRQLRVDCTIGKSGCWGYSLIEAAWYRP